ncbi:MAG: CNNM domain-containing protein, partial [Acetobacteraceae bacterium]
MAVLFEILFVVLLILINGLFAMSELALVSARRARLAALARDGVRGATLARRLVEDPQSYLPTVQIGITLVAILTGVYGGAQIAAQFAHRLAEVPALKPVAEPLALAAVVIVITYLTLVIGELVPKQLALRRPEPIAAKVAGPIAVLARVA